ncbi:hypothetical protein [Latilactobacillus sakei]|uniref:hypothetical protein n=1 Tax=Latilactobacillus sakei TaxID=1599 RepID=UPI00097752A4|nr:hypothetical protein [Latilactobacillus sakei]
MKKRSVGVTIILMSLLLVAFGNKTDQAKVSSSKKSVTVQKNEKSSTKKSATSSSAQSTTSGKNTDGKFQYSILGTWYSNDTKVTYNEDGTIVQVSDASGMTNRGTYQILKETKDSLIIEQILKVKNAGKDKQQETFKFTDKNHFNDELVDWKK